MRNIFWDIEFIYDTLRRGGPYALGGGVLVLVLGLIFGKITMIVAGAIVAFVGLVDVVILLIVGKREKN